VVSKWTIDPLFKERKRTVVEKKEEPKRPRRKKTSQARGQTRSRPSPSRPPTAKPLPPRAACQTGPRLPADNSGAGFQPAAPGILPATTTERGVYGRFTVQNLSAIDGLIVGHEAA